MHKNRLMINFLFLVMSMLVLPLALINAQQPPAPVTGLTVICGDTNADGAVNIVDALRIAQAYIGLTPADFISDGADVNNSGTIDIVDALQVAQFYVGILSGLACGDTTLPALEEAFEMIDFTSQDWYGGVFGSGGGTYFTARFTVIIPSVDSIEGVWIEDRFYAPAMTNVTSPGTLPYVKGDELQMTLNYRWIPAMEIHEPNQEASEEPPLEEGPDFTGAALILLRVNDETKGFIVDTIRILDPIAYP